MAARPRGPGRPLFTAPATCLLHSSLPSLSLRACEAMDPAGSKERPR